MSPVALDQSIRPLRYIALTDGRAVFNTIIHARIERACKK